MPAIHSTDRLVTALLVLAAALTPSACTFPEVLGDSPEEGTSGVSSTGGGDEPETSSGEAPTSAADETGATDGGVAGSCVQSCAETWEFAGDVEITSETDLAAFACVGKISGLLYLNGDLAPAALQVFAELREVGGGLLISRNPQLTGLSFLGCLEATPELQLNDLPNLLTGELTALRSAPRLSFLNMPALPSFGPDYLGLDHLFINSPQLSDLGPAEDWPALGGLTLIVEHNAQLTGLEPLAHLIAQVPTASTIHLTDLPALTSLDALAAMESGELRLIGLPLVDSLAPLAKLTQSPLLLIRDLPALDSLVGLDQLSLVGSLQLGQKCYQDPGLAGITSLAGLGGLEFVESFTIANSPALATLAGADVLAIAQAVNVVGSPLISQAEFDAFVAPLEPTVAACLGEWNQCDCN